MFKIIGSDNREYGPASEEVLRRWIAEGRANAGSQVLKEGETAWRSLSTVTEFAAALAAGAAPPVPSVQGQAPAPGPGASWGSDSASAGASPATSLAASPSASIGAVDANALAAELLARDFTLDIGGCVQRSWELLQKNFWIIVAGWAVSFFIACGLWLIPYVGLPASMVLGAVLLGGLHWFFLRLLRGEPASVADVFAGFGPAIGPLILCGVVSFLLTVAGACLCLIPGIYLAVCWHLAAIVILDKKLEFWAAMELSRKVVTRHWWGMFGLMLVAVLLWFAGFLGCGILLFITGPIATVAIVESYRRLFETKPVEPQVFEPTGIAAAPAPGAPVP